MNYSCPESHYKYTINKNIIFVYVINEDIVYRNAYEIQIFNFRIFLFNINWGIISKIRDLKKCFYIIDYN